MMQTQFSINIDAWTDGSAIPTRFAFGKPGTDGPFALSDNINPEVKWSSPPAGTQSFALICHDPDVPSSAEDVNQADRTIPASLPRVSFFHWLLVDIPPTVFQLDEGVSSHGVTARGKPTGATQAGITGQNSYTGWFKGDPDMEGIYGGYDGPCPPWNDSIIHHYHFTIYALDIPTLNLNQDYAGPAVLEAMKGHILAQASHCGTYSMNPALRA